MMVLSTTTSSSNFLLVSEDDREAHTKPPCSGRNKVRAKSDSRENEHLTMHQMYIMTVSL